MWAAVGTRTVIAVENDGTGDAINRIGNSLIDLGGGIGYRELKVYLYLSLGTYGRYMKSIIGTGIIGKECICVI